jgi:hypothetical protein
MPDKACCYKLTSVIRVTLSKNELCSTNQFMSSFRLILLKRRAYARQKRLRDLVLAPEPAQLGSSHGTGAGAGAGPGQELKPRPFFPDEILYPVPAIVSAVVPGARQLRETYFYLWR